MVEEGGDMHMGLMQKTMWAERLGNGEYSWAKRVAGELGERMSVLFNTGSNSYHKNP